MTRKDKINALQAIASGRVVLKEAINELNKKQNGYFNVLVGLDLVDFLDGKSDVLKDIITKDGTPGRILIKNNLPAVEEIYV